MKKIFFILMIIFSFSASAKEETQIDSFGKEVYQLKIELSELKKEFENYFSDSLSQIPEINSLQRELIKLKKEHEKFEYQKNYFTQAIDAQGGIYNNRTAVLIGIITIIIAVLAIAVSVFLRYDITNKNKITKELLDANERKTKELFDNLKKDRHEQAANMYIIQAGLLTENEEKLKYCVYALKEFFQGQLFSEFSEHIDEPYFSNLIDSIVSFTSEIKTELSDVLATIIANIDHINPTTQQLTTIKNKVITLKDKINNKYINES